jgi:hypothetical protein
MMIYFKQNFLCTICPREVQTVTTLNKTCLYTACIDTNVIVQYVH